jgi:hypothetical protein
MAAINQAYASNSETALQTIEFAHSTISGGYLRLVKAKYDLTATLENSNEVTFTRASIKIQRASRATSGKQDLNFVISNLNNVAWRELNAIVIANRTSEEKLICKYREYLESDLSQPASGVYPLTVISTSSNRIAVTFHAGYTPLPNMAFPRFRYYPTIFPGLKYL